MKDRSASNSRSTLQMFRRDISLTEECFRQIHVGETNKTTTHLDTDDAGPWRLALVGLKGRG